MQIYKKTDIGMRRTSNQDFCDGGLFADGTGWLIVCDGMGGANGGNIASALAAEEIGNAITDLYEPSMDGAAIRRLLLSAVEGANLSIYDMAQADPKLYGMGTTVVTAILKEDTAHIVHVGDSRAYLITPEAAKQVTVDHSMVQELVDTGNLTPEEAKNHPQKNIITRALGVRPSVNAEYDEVPYRAGDILLACTDGMSAYADEADLYALAQQAQGEQLAEDLVNTAIEGGGSDNITVVLADNRTV